MLSIIKSMLFLAVIALMFCTVSANSCSPDEIETRWEACLDGIQNSVIDKDRYWFGTGFFTKCGQNPSGWLAGDCFNPLMKAGLSVKDIINVDSQGVDRYLNITFTSKPGNYTACDHTFVQDEEKVVMINPISTDTVSPWDVRDTPYMSWNPDQGKMYTLVVIDVANGPIHGLFVNIPGNDVSQSVTIKPYHGPKNGQEKANLYIFLLYEQPGMIEVSNEWMVRLNSWGQANAFKIEDFVNAYTLTGPKGVNNMLAWNDRYSVNMMMQMGVMNNCVPFVKKALKKEVHKRPFIPSDPNLSVFLRIHFENEPLEFSYCCQKHEYKQKMFFLDPTGDSIVQAPMTRSSNPVKVFLQMNKLFPNITMDFRGKIYTLVAVDPDVPSAAIGTNERPLLHWLAVNNQVDENGQLVFGHVLQNYSGPMPPDDKPHTYYFMLFEQKNGQMLEMNSTTAYTGECQDRLKTRCLFNVNTLVSENELTLVGMSWMTASNDDYVNYQNKRDQKDACKNRKGYADPCPSKKSNETGGSRGLSSTLLSIFIVAITCVLSALV